MLDLLTAYREMDKEFAKWRWLMRFSGILNIMQFLLLMLVISNG